MWNQKGISAYIQGIHALSTVSSSTLGHTQYKKKHIISFPLPGEKATFRHYYKQYHISKLFRDEPQVAYSTKISFHGIWAITAGLNSSGDSRNAT